MLKPTFNLFVFLLIGRFYEAQAQAFDNSTLVYDQFFQNYYLVNPASQDTSARLKIQLGNRTLINLFDGVNRLYGDLNYAIKHRYAYRYSNLGALVTNARDGDFISRTSVYGRYGWRTALTARSSLSVGLALGVVNYAIRGSQVDPGGSAWALDGNMGIWYIRQRFKVGVSYMQMFSQTIQPVRQSFLLQPYWNINAQGLVFKTYWISLNTHFFASIRPGLPLQLEVAPVFLLSKWVETGINYRHQKGIALLLGLKSIPVLDGKINFMASYLFNAIPNSLITDNLVELSLGYAY